MTSFIKTHMLSAKPMTPRDRAMAAVPAVHHLAAVKWDEFRATLFEQIPAELRDMIEIDIVIDVRVVSS